MVDWSARGNSFNYVKAVVNTRTVGNEIARFVNSNFLSRFIVPDRWTPRRNAWILDRRTCFSYSIYFEVVVTSRFVWSASVDYEMRKTFWVINIHTFLAIIFTFPTIYEFFFCFLPRERFIHSNEFKWKEKKKTKRLCSNFGFSSVHLKWKKFVDTHYVSIFDSSVPDNPDPKNRRHRVRNFFRILSESIISTYFSTKTYRILFKNVL